MSKAHTLTTSRAGPTALTHTRPPLVAVTLPVSAVDAATREEMWRLFSQYYTEVGRGAFLHDLAGKDHVILLRDHARALKGFSTAQGYVREVQGRRIGVVFSGDTIVDREYWGQTVLQRAFLRYIVRFKLRHPFTPVYWFLISKGYKTYLLMARNFPVYWPRHDMETPAWERAVLDSLAREKFGASWRPDLGILRFERCLGRLRGSVAPIDDELRARYAEVRFFEQKNPGHAEGDELCCIGLINPFQWLYYLGRLGYRRVRRVLRPLTR